MSICLDCFPPLITHFRTFKNEQLADCQMSLPESIKLWILRLPLVAGWDYSVTPEDSLQRGRRPEFSSSWMQLFDVTNIYIFFFVICPNKLHWRSKRCGAGAGWGITLVDDRVIPRKGGLKDARLLCAPQAWIDSRTEAKRRGEWDGEAIQSAPISLSLSIPFVTCHSLAPTNAPSCPEPVIHSDVATLADRPRLQHLLLNLETNHLRESDWWMVFWKLWRSRISQTWSTVRCQLIIIAINIKRWCALTKKKLEGEKLATKTIINISVYIHPETCAHIFIISAHSLYFSAI